MRHTELAPHASIEGAQGVHLTPLRSLGVEKSMHVYGRRQFVMLVPKSIKLVGDSLARRAARQLEASTGAAQSSR